MARTVLLALLAIGAAAWGLVRHYTVRPPPFYVNPASTGPGSNDTVEAPDLEVEPNEAARQSGARGGPGSAPAPQPR